MNVLSKKGERYINHPTTYKSNSYMECTPQFPDSEETVPFQFSRRLFPWPATGCREMSRISRGKDNQ